MLRKADQKRENVLADALRVGPRSVDDLDSAGRRRVDVDLVVAHAVPSHDSEVLAAVQEGRIDDAGGPDDEPIDTDNLAL